MDQTMSAGRQEHKETRLQVERAFAGLSDLDLIKLKRIAQVRTLGLIGFDWEDLLQESVLRALRGTRVWPQDVPFMAFLIQTMKSVVHEARALASRSPITTEADLPHPVGSGADSVLPEVATDMGNPERDAIVRDSLRAIESLFSDDADVTAVLRALAEGMSPDEAQSAGGMTPLRYEAAQKRMRRKLNKRFGSETKT